MLTTFPAVLVGDGRYPRLHGAHNLERLRVKSSLRWTTAHPSPAKCLIPVLARVPWLGGVLVVYTAWRYVGLPLAHHGMVGARPHGLAPRVVLNVGS
jgi:hypothetical protein